MNVTAAVAENLSAFDMSEPVHALSAGLAANDFELFALPQRFEQERAVLDARWKDMQREAHPDRFAAQGAAAQRIAMQWSVRINEAYQRLKDPLKRAAYLCELHGAAIDAERNTVMPSDFLMQQMQWRESLDDAHTLSSLEALQRDVLQAHCESLQNCATLIDQQQQFESAAQQVRRLMFIERFMHDIDNKMDALDAA
jgi:molecular chaperone HscB